MNIHNEILKEFFNCDKCLKVMIDPVSTKCGHKFCLKCLSIETTDFFCSVCKIYLNKNEFHSNLEMKKTIKVLNENSKSRAMLESTFHNWSDNKCWEYSHNRNDDNFEMSENANERIVPTEVNFLSNNINSNFKNVTNSQMHIQNMIEINSYSDKNVHENNKFLSHSKYRIKRKHNEMDKCFRVECKYENVENKLDEFMKTFSTTENEFSYLNLINSNENNYNIGNNFKINHYDYNQITKLGLSKNESFENIKQSTNYKYSIPEKKFKR